MVPILIVAGLVISLLPRWWRIAAVLAVGAASVLIFARDDLITQPTDMLGIVGLAVINAGIGAFFGWLIRSLLARRSDTEAGEVMSRIPRRSSPNTGRQKDGDHP